MAVVRMDLSFSLKEESEFDGVLIDSFGFLEIASLRDGRSGETEYETIFHL